MKLLLLLAAFFLAASAQAAIDPARVLVIYNSAEPKSKILGTDYAKARNIPARNVVGFDLPTTPDISREDYNNKLRGPLRKLFTDESWWVLGKHTDGIIQPIDRKFDLLVCMKGVPVRISVTDPSNDPHVESVSAELRPLNQASVDSELSYFGVEGLPIGGPLQNKYFDVENGFDKVDLPHMFLVGRIDGPKWSDCVRMIKDALAIEQTGLWGMCYLDKSGKYPQGDQWLDTIENRNSVLGIPTVLDDNKDTYVTYYPMDDAALYYGWYAFNKDGPFLNPAFRFRRGAVAVHIHSYSAENIRDPQNRWVGPLITAGAAATVGNTYEPYLQMTHHLDIFHRYLTRGSTLVEAAWRSIPVVSWNNVVIGDPLYRPFAHLQSRGGKSIERDTAYRAIVSARVRWGLQRNEYENKIRIAANKLGTGTIFEDMGLRARKEGKGDIAISHFTSAKEKYGNGSSGALRCDMHIIDIHRERGEISTVRTLLQSIAHRYETLPEGAALKALRVILDPEAPPAAVPGKPQP